MNIIINTLQNRLPFLFVTATILSLSSCTVLKTMRDKNDIRYVKKHQQEVYDNAVAAVAYFYGKNIRFVDIDTLSDKALRKQLAGYEDVSVVFHETSKRTNEPTDSIVTFSRSTLLLGWREIVYDFAARPRTFPDDRSNKSSYIFVKIADRIYYRRRPIPMM